MKVNHSLQRLFTSNTRAKLVSIFFGEPKNLFYVRELVRLTHEEINSVRRELDNLKRESLVSSEIRGNRLYYWANLTHYLAYDLQVIACKHHGLGLEIIQNKTKIGNIKLLAFSQNFINGQLTPNSIDILMVGDINSRQLENLIQDYESKTGQEINFTCMDKNEFKARKIRRDPILVDFFLNSPGIIYGQPVDLL